MAKWTDYTTDTNPTDTDEVMTLDTDKSPKANKRVTLSTLADYFSDKLASKVFAKLETQNKTVIGALNELNSKKQSALKTIGKQYLANEQGVITTEIDRKAIIVSCRSNNAIVEPFVSTGTNYWNAVIRDSNGYPVSDKNIYITFFYFE